MLPFNTCNTNDLIYHLNPIERREKNRKSLSCILHILSYLDNSSLYNFSLTSHRFLDISQPIWQQRLENRIRSAVAAVLKQKRGYWTETQLDLHWPFKDLLKISCSLGILDDSWGDKPELKLVREYTKTNNIEDLKQTLIAMKSAGKLHHLNSRYYGNHPLELAAIYGNIESARLLLEYGAADALCGTSRYTSKDGVAGMSALFYAARAGKVAMVKLLIEKGAVPNLNLEEQGYNQPLIPTLIWVIESENTDILACLFLLIHAWKAKEGHKAVCEHEDAKLAFTIAVEQGYANTANLLFEFGIREKLPKKLIVQIAYNAIVKKNLEMIKFLHHRELIDFKSLETQSGTTFLHTAVALNAKEILHYLLAEVKIPTNTRNTKGETYEVSGKRVLEENIRRAIIHNLYSYAGFFDEVSQFQAESLEECLQHNIDLNVPIDENGHTLLHRAMERIVRLDSNGDKGIINQLLDYGANPHIKDNNGITPLDKAREMMAKAERDKEWWNGDEIRLNMQKIITKMEAIKIK